MRPIDDMNIDVPENARRQRKLMTSVLATQIQDYLYAKGITDDIEGERARSIQRGIQWIGKKPSKELRKTAVLTRGLAAMAYIFEDTWESGNYVFGFKFICRCIELEPEKFRIAIRRLKMEHIRGIWDRARGREEIVEEEETDD